MQRITAKITPHIVSIRVQYGHPSTAYLRANGCKWDPAARHWWVGITHPCCDDVLDHLRTVGAPVVATAPGGQYSNASPQKSGRYRGLWD